MRSRDYLNLDLKINSEDNNKPKHLNNQNFLKWSIYLTIEIQFEFDLNKES